MTLIFVRDGRTGTGWRRLRLTRYELADSDPRPMLGDPCRHRHLVIGRRVETLVPLCGR